MRKEIEDLWTLHEADIERNRNITDINMSLMDYITGKITKEELGKKIKELENEAK